MKKLSCLIIFDILSKLDMHLAKEVAKELLSTPTHKKLVLDWRKKQQSRAAVKNAVEVIMDRLPEKHLCSGFLTLNIHQLPVRPLSPTISLFMNYGIWYFDLHGFLKGYLRENMKEVISV